MSELSIKIKIGDREYPMRVEASEEQLLRLAGRNINEKLKAYSSQFGIDDKQDLLAMVAFDAIVSKMRSESGTSDFENQLNQKLSHIDGLLSSHIQES